MKAQNNLKKIKNELNKIIDHIINQGIENADDIYWETLSVTNEKINHSVNETIYKGNSGIMLFFLETYRNTHDQKLLTVVQKSCNWINNFCKANPSNFFSFLTGRMGVAYAFMRVNEVTGDKEYIDRAIKIALECSEMIEPKREAKIDLINGAAGTLLTLLHLYNVSKNSSILEYIKQFTYFVLENLELNDKGIYWQRQKSDIRGLCGTSHGSSGIGWVLLEVSRLFDDDQLKNLTMQTINYENSYFDTELNNWPDFRKDISDANSVEKYLEYYYSGDITKFERPSNMKSWCHGAPGIGLNRLQFSKHSNFVAPHQDAELALSATKTYLKKSDKPVHVLCHGTAGNAFLFLEHYFQTGNLESLEFARDMALTIQESRRELGFYYSGYSTAGKAEDLSLYMGTAGIGYFMLACLYPLTVTNYLLPSVNIRSEPLSPFLTKDSICELLLKKVFIHSYHSKLLKGFVDTIDLKARGLLDKMIVFMKKNSRGTKYEVYYDLEIKSLLLDINNRSWCLDYICEIDKINKVTDAYKDKEGLEEKFVRTSANTVFSSTSAHEDNGNLIFYVNYLGRKSFKINEEVYVILSAAEEGKRVGDLRSAFIEGYEIEEDKLEELTNFFDLQLRQLLQAGIIEFY